jgi:hypothetical protein
MENVDKVVAKQLDDLAKTIARETEADLRARFVMDIVAWTSIRNRPFSPLPLAQEEANENGVFATGVNCSVKQSLLEGAGRGLFANRPLKKGSVIEFFDGRVVSESSVKQFQKDSRAFCTHCITLVKNLWVLDCTATFPSAVQQMKGASFANSKFPSNAQVRVRQDREGLTTVAFLVAKQNILPGTEIVFNYSLG